MSSSRASFDRAFVATAYLLGRRDADLLVGLPAASPEAHRLATALGSEDRAERARLLAAELSALARGLQARRLA